MADSDFNWRSHQKGNNSKSSSDTNNARTSNSRNPKSSNPKSSNPKSSNPNNRNNSQKSYKNNQRSQSQNRYNNKRDNPKPKDNSRSQSPISTPKLNSDDFPNITSSPSPSSEEKSQPKSSWSNMVKKAPPTPKEEPKNNKAIGELEDWHDRPKSGKFIPGPIISHANFKVMNRMEQDYRRRKREHNNYREVRMEESERDVQLLKMLKESEYWDQKYRCEINRFHQEQYEDEDDI
jgi:hypothetical protein